MHAAGGQLAEDVDAGLDVGNVGGQRVIIIRGERGGVEGGDEQGFRGQLRIGDDAVGALDEGNPEAALEEQVPDLGALERGDLLRTEIDGFLFAVGLHEDGEQFALLAADDLLHGAADRRGEQDPGAGFVCHDGRAREDAVTFFHEQPGQEPLEVRGLDGDDIRSHRLDRLLGGDTLDRNVEALLEMDGVGHYR